MKMFRRQEGCRRISSMAGQAGFEPTRDGVKVRCLTAWRLPNIVLFFLFCDFDTFINESFDVSFLSSTCGLFDYVVYVLPERFNRMFFFCFACVFIVQYSAQFFYLLLYNYALRYFCYGFSD